MLALDEILKAWRHQKRDRHSYRLSAVVAVSFEFRGPQWGHPSNYASVQIAGEPADDLEVAFVADLPPALGVEYRGKLETAVGMAAVDELLAAQWIPLSGCRLVVREVGWDDVMSSEVAIYRAARGALIKLRQEGSWELVTKQ